MGHLNENNEMFPNFVNVRFWHKADTRYFGKWTIKLLLNGLYLFQAISPRNHTYIKDIVSIPC